MVEVGVMSWIKYSNVVRKDTKLYLCYWHRRATVSVDDYQPCNDPLAMTQYCLLLAPSNQTFKEVIYSGTIFAETRLTA
jgi:hypothetical protein